MSIISVAHECVVLDACCVINLYASGHMADILASLDRSVAVAGYVRDAEARYVRGRIADGVQEPKQPINLQPFIEQGSLSIIDADTDAEQVDYLNFAAGIGHDGEAISAAIARHRNWALAIDDIQARLFLAPRMPHIQFATTPELVKQWADSGNIPDTIVRSVLRDIQVRGNYRPGRAEPLSNWWRALAR